MENNLLDETTQHPYRIRLSNLMYPLLSTKYVPPLNHRIFTQVLFFPKFDITHSLPLHKLSDVYLTSI